MGSILSDTFIMIPVTQLTDTSRPVSLSPRRPYSLNNYIFKNPRKGRFVRKW